MSPGEAWPVGAGGAKSLAFLGVVLGVGLKRTRSRRCVLRRLANALVAYRRRWRRRRRHRSGCCCCCFGGRQTSCVGCVDGKASDICAKNDGDGDDDGDDEDDEGHHLSSPSLPSRKILGKKRKRMMAIRRADVGVARTGRASGCSAEG